MVKSQAPTVTDFIEEKLAALSDRIENLATKNDICVLLKNIEDKFESELSERDKMIYELEEKLSQLSEKRKDDLEYAKRLNDKVTLLENKLVENIREIGNDCDDESHEIDEVKQPLDMLIIGDSICRYLNVDLINPGGNNKLICRPGAKIGEIKEALINFESQYTVDKLIVHVMTNHIPEDTPTGIAKEMLGFVDDIQLNMPDTDLYISLVLPKYDASWLEGINDLNLQIHNESRRLGFSVIQHPQFAKRGHINNDLLSRDRIHLSRQGIKQLGIDIKYSLRK